MKRFLNRVFDISTIKFIIVGIANTIVGTLVMFGLYNIAGASYWFSSAMNYIVGSILSYFLNKYFTFKYAEKNFKSILRFIVNISICYLVAYGGAKRLVLFLLSTQQDNIRDNISMLVGMCLFVVLNYLGQKFFVFRERNEESI